MSFTNWKRTVATIVLQHQTKEKPLFPDLLWARPERKEQAGRLLIIGGSTHGFASIVKAYEYALAAGIGEIKVVLPGGVKKLVGPVLDALYADDVAGGSFAHKALAEIQPYLAWSESVLLPGELTNNGETTLLAEDILRKYAGPVVVAGDAVEAITKTLSEDLPSKLIIVADFRQLQRLAYSHSGKQPLLSTSTLVQQVAVMQALSAKLDLGVLARHDENQILVASSEHASLTPTSRGILEFAASTVVLAAQFPTMLYEATATAAIL
jgi:NAD(P)H-hydrate repair Nnr-like enzyme with NAD(P)H-hydrate dehydratase domain